MKYTLVVKCSDGSTRQVDNIDADSPEQAANEAYSRLMYFGGATISEVIGVATDES